MVNIYEAERFGKVSHKIYHGRFYEGLSALGLPVDH